MSKASRNWASLGCLYRIAPATPEDWRMLGQSLDCAELCLWAYGIHGTVKR